jgi:hypothetical protein
VEERKFKVLHGLDGEVHEMTGEELLKLISVIATPVPETDEKFPDEWLVIWTRHR